MVLRGSKHRNYGWLLGLVVLAVVGLDLGIYALTEWQWFADVNYTSVLIQRLQVQGALFVLGVGVSLGVLWDSLHRALRHAPRPEPATVAARKGGLPLRWLLGTAVALALLVAVQLLYQGQIALSHWQQNYTLYSPTSPPPLWPKPGAATALAVSIWQQPWQLVLVAAVALALLLKPRRLVGPVAVLMSLGFGITLSAYWSRVLLAFRPTRFNEVDPIFQRDIGFYIFQLPVLELLEYWLVGLCFFALVAVVLLHLLGDDTINRGHFYGFSPPQQRHLYGLGAAFFLATSLSHWLARFRILYSQDGVVYGAGYTDVHVSLVLNWVLSVLTLAIGLGVGLRCLLWGQPHSLGVRLQALRLGKPLPPREMSVSVRPLALGIGAYLLVALLGVTVVPATVQRLVVQPNELLREQPYITNSIRLTRAAFDLVDIDSEPFDPSGELTAEELEGNAATLDNVRLWDTQPLLESNRQLQEIRLYYEFRDADVDRYTLVNDEGSPDLRQVIVSARELNYEQVPDIAKTWVNQHLVYTHGYGFTMSPVNTASPDGLPAYFVRGIDQDTSSEAVRRSIPTDNPRLYFGELTNSFLLTNTSVPELDFPGGEDNIYTTYAGRSGIAVGPFSQRLLYARRLRDWRMLFSEDLLPQSRVLFRRNITRRVQAIAPFLRFDADPYLVVANAGDISRSWGTGPPPADVDASVELDLLRQRNPDLDADSYQRQSGENHLYWIIDAYTASNHYPYSDPGENDFNYIRNSVKVVVDAYHGSVGFFVSEPDDPILRSWQQLQPRMFQPMEALPLPLRSHIRYPQDLFQVQSDVLTTYHMTDPQVFYNREDQWRAPNEIYRNEAQRVPPYYLIMRLPEGEAEEFMLLRLFTPVQRNNLVAWLAARSDGDNYGLRLLYRFPKQELVFGPEQIEARINQDPAISQRISLWDTEGSRAQQGHLLVIPIERSLLYVEPLYLVAEQNQLPALARVIAVYRNRIAMGETLEDALNAIFQSQRPSTPTLLRELDDTELPLPGGNIVPEEPVPETVPPEA